MPAPAPAPAAAPARGAAAALGVLALLLGLGTTSAVIALRAPAPPGQREALLAEIDARATVAAAAAERVAAARAQIDARATREGEAAVVAATERAQRLAATAPAAGPGLRVLLDDAPGSRSAAPGTDPRSAVPGAQGLVLDRDLQVVTNGLFAAGADAVAINDHRLTALSSIRVAGQAILVDYQPLTPPYRVEAVGDPDAVATAFAASPAGAYLSALASTYDVQVTSTSQRSLTLPAGSVEGLRHAVPAETGAAR